MRKRSKTYISHKLISLLKFRSLHIISVNIYLYRYIEDKLVSTSGYGIVVTDEASSFFQDIKGQDNRNESNIGLMNQLFDGRGDKTSLAQL